MPGAHARQRCGRHRMPAPVDEVREWPWPVSLAVLTLAVLVDLIGVLVTVDLLTS